MPSSLVALYVPAKLHESQPTRQCPFETNDQMFAPTEHTSGTVNSEHTSMIIMLIWTWL